MSCIVLESVKNNESKSDKSQTLQNIQHENTMLKTELTNFIQMHEREMKGIKTVYQHKVNDAHKRMNLLEKKKSSDHANSFSEQIKLHQLNLQLNQKIKILNEEFQYVTESHAILQKEKVILQEKLDSKISEVEALEDTSLEDKRKFKDSVTVLEMQLNKERVLKQEKELVLASERNQVKLTKESLDNLEKECKAQVIEAKSEVEKFKKQFLKMEKDFQIELEGLKQKLENEICKHNALQQESKKNEKILESKYLSIRQQHLTEMQGLMLENNDLICKLEVLESDKHSYLRETEERSLELKKKIEAKNDEVATIKRENLLLKNDLINLDEMEILLSKEKQKNHELRSQIKSLQSEIRVKEEDKKSYKQEFEALHDKAQNYEKELHHAQFLLKKERNAHSKTLLDYKNKNEEATNELHEKIVLLQKERDKKSNDLKQELQRVLGKRRLYARLIKKLRHRLEAAELREKEMEAKQLALQENSVPSHRYLLLQRQLHDIVSKHAGFQTIIKGFREAGANISQVSDMNQKVRSIGDKLEELEVLQSQALSDMQSL